jgi:hypothetical protein
LAREIASTISGSTPDVLSLAKFIDIADASKIYAFSMEEFSMINKKLLAGRIKVSAGTLIKPADFAASQNKSDS